MKRSKPRDTPGCTGKVRYETRQAARFFGSARLQRAYPCKACGGWHLTTRIIPGRRVA